MPFAGKIKLADFEGSLASGEFVETLDYKFAKGQIGLKLENGNQIFGIVHISSPLGHINEEVKIFTI